MRTLKGEKLEQELLRLEAMKEYEKKYGAGAVVCGIDEAGRGPLAGPVVAGSLHSACGLPDSLSERFQKAVGKTAGGSV